MTATLAEALDHQHAGRLREAKRIYRRILSREPANGDALHLLGLIAFQQGHIAEGVDRIRKAIDSNPANPIYYENLGKILAEQRRAAEAAACFEQLLARWPENVEARLRLGNCRLQQNRLEEAGECFRQALARKPDSVEGLTNLGYVLRQQRRPEPAIDLLRKALEIDPGHAEALLTLGAALGDQGENDEAGEVCVRLLGLRPDLAEVHHNLGSIRRRQGRLEEAAACHREAIRLRPSYAMSHNNLGVVLLQQGNIEEAAGCFREAVRHDPGYAAAHSNLLLTLHYAPQPDPTALFSEHRRWQQQHAAPHASARLPHTNTPGRERRLRIGYLSADFRTHPVAFFFGPILDGHDRQQVECYCYADVWWPDAVTEKLQALADCWRDIHRLSDEQVAAMVRQDGIDILVDLGGHTSQNRLQVFARKPAPVQATYLGYPDTTGLDAMDYRLTDAWADPPGSTEQWHSEQLVRLPRGFLCYRPFADAPPAPELPAATAGIFTFGCFNARPKVTPEVIATWSAILKETPESRLLLKAKALSDESTRRQLLEAFSACGIAPERVQTRGVFPDLLQHLKAYQEIDLALDTFPYNGTTTTCEALWMGVPVVTLAGRTHASRVGLSLLSRLGLEACITDTVQSYIDLAVRLARHPQPLRDVRAGLRQRMARSSLTDALGFVRDLEQAYREMWRRWCDGRPAPAPAPPPSRDELERRVAAFPYWYHRIELPGGVTTPGWAPLHPDKYRIPADLAGKRVLDVGAWDGYWSFEALRRGARQVVAIDDFSDFLGQLRPCDRRAWEPFDFCREALGYDSDRCQRYEMSVYEATAERLGRFDVVFFFGALYHLKHPLLALDRLAALCDGEIYVESAILDDYSPYRGGLGHGYPGGQMLMEFYPDNQYGNNATNWWAPTLHCLGHMVRSAGFSKVEAWKLTQELATHLAVCRGFVRGSKRDAP